ncbi:hypothetical protein [uncultured Adlercreutzia sp.]|uniref:hypothetical protein n=1 Tax=uncultured Adlercreutzia sp. TaxID=875803 RepID=UPI0025DEA5F7|nr:hypothetical protein [uncultured Adlercreutzia sp.]MCI9261915.1 hypothetical protein [Eggerthellaceae bacterium]
MSRISSRSVFSNVGRVALAALLAGAVIGLAGCASTHPMIKSGQACSSCHGDDHAAVDSPDLSKATETGLTFAIDSSADEVSLCTASIAEDGTVIPERQRTIPASEFGEVTISSPGLYALCTGDVASPSATVLINATENGPADVAVRV